MEITNTDIKIEYTMNNGEKVIAKINGDGQWHQEGASKEALGACVDTTETIADAIATA